MSTALALELTGYAEAPAGTYGGRMWRWLKWKLLCARWRLDPGMRDPSRIRWPEKPTRER